MPLADCVVMEVSELLEVDAPSVAHVRFANGQETDLFTDALTLVARPRRSRSAVKV